MTIFDLTPREFEIAKAVNEALKGPDPVLMFVSYAEEPVRLELLRGLFSDEWDKVTYFYAVEIDPDHVSMVMHRYRELSAGWKMILLLSQPNAELIEWKNRVNEEARKGRSA